MYALDIVCMSETTAPEGLLAKVQKKPAPDLALDEKIAVRTASQLEPASPTHILFRRFSDGRSSHVAAYIVDNEKRQYDSEQISQLHHHTWLCGAAPLLYVADSRKVSIYSCLTPAKRDSKGAWQSKPIDVLSTANEIEKLTQRQNYSAFRLVEGTFWEDPRNASLINANKTAHKILIEKVCKADEQLDGKNNPTARHMLLLSLLLKYLEDRNVIKPEWFKQYAPEATSCIHIFKHGREATLEMLEALEAKFNGDIFALKKKDKSKLSDVMLYELAEAVDARADAHKQLYFWDIFSFKYIPVEILSHIYQQFAEEGKGAIFTPPLVVNLLLDFAMPLATLKGTETILDPACGSGIFLVSAFRRLVYARLAKDNRERLLPRELTEMLAQSIFGCELQSTAAELTAFSLALAVCDALQPEVIWKELQFDKLLHKNIKVGDFSEYIAQIKESTPSAKGFDIVLGNPPFMTTLTASMKHYAKQREFVIPGKQTAYLFLLACLHDALAPAGTLCMVQNAGFIYNEGTKKLKKVIFEHFSVKAILDFVSIGGLFEGANAPVVAVLAKKSLPDKDYLIKHLTFRRTKTTKGRIGFELDYYDHHTIPQSVASQNVWAWKANLLGGGRCFALAERLTKLPTLKNFVYSKGWKMGEGFIECKKNKKHAPWLKGMRLLPTSAFTYKCINKDKLDIIKSEWFQTPCTKEHFTKPLFLIHQHEKLSCIFWDECDLSYKKQIVGIFGVKNEADELQALSKCFINKRNELCVALNLLSPRTSVSKATATLAGDIERLPWPQDGDWHLVPWEKELLDDINTYMAEYVRLGQNSALLKKWADASHMKAYQETFLRLMHTAFPEMQACGSGHKDGLMYQAFSFSNAEHFNWGVDNWSEHVRKTIFSTQGNTHSFMSVRLLRYYSEEYVIFIKPDSLRYWLRSTAIRDVDDTLSDIMREDENG